MQQKDPSPSFGLAHGACLFIRRREYESIGGHACVKQEIFEDTVLARTWREKKLKGLCLNGRNHITVRMYTSLRQIIAGFSKIAYPAFRKERSFWLFIAFHFLFMLMPFFLLTVAQPLGLSFPVLSIAVGAVLSARVIQCVQFGYPIWPVLFHPAAEIGLIGLGLHARHQCRYRAGITWKGRRYNPAGKP
jgi:chlorobactene glucosyltransferase